MFFSNLIPRRNEKRKIISNLNHFFELLLPNPGTVVESFQTEPGLTSTSDAYCSC